MLHPLQRILFPEMLGCSADLQSPKRPALDLMVFYVVLHNPSPANNEIQMHPCEHEGCSHDSIWVHSQCMTRPFPQPSISGCPSGEHRHISFLLFMRDLWVSHLHNPKCTMFPTAVTRPEAWPKDHGNMQQAAAHKQLFSLYPCVFIFLKMEMWLPIKRPRRICQQKHCRCRCNQTPTLLSIWHNYQTFLRKTEWSEIGFTFCFPFRPF